MNIKSSVYVATVTYGDRYDYLSKVIEQLLDMGVGGIVVVNNASSMECSRRLSILENSEPRIKVLWLDANTGSANGYYQGLLYLTNLDGCKYIWMLDDDNCPKDDALDVICKKVGNIRKMEDICFLSLRPDRKEYVAVANGEPVDNVFPSENSFLGFDIQKKFFKKKNENVYMDEISVPYAPYGGMFFRKEVLKKIGLPLREFFLYSDDHEFSYRFCKEGGGIILVPESIIYDIDKSWYIGKRKNAIDSFLTGDKKRVYYNIRNRVFLESNYLTNNILKYYVNMSVYFTFLCFRSLFFKKNNIGIICIALKDGFMGKLGEVY